MNNHSPQTKPLSSGLSNPPKTSLERKDKTADSHSVTMQITNVFKLIDNGDLDETDFNFACPYCNEEIEFSGLDYWFCYKCSKKIFREDFKL